MPRTFVTGATGFIGKRLVESLIEQGEEVACLVRSTSQTAELERLGVELRRGSLSDRLSLDEAFKTAFAGRGIDRVYHLAGLTHATRLTDFMEANAQGTANLCEAVAALESPPVVIVTSSLAAAGPATPDKPHVESALPAPVSNYGRSKLAAEQAARRVADRVPISIVRPPVVFGPGDRDGLLLFKAIRRVPIHAVPQMQGLPLSLIYSDDLVTAMATVGEQGERLLPDAPDSDSTGLYYAADPTVASYAEMGRFAAAAMGRRIWVLRRRIYPFLPVALAGDLIGRLRGKAPLFGMDKLREASAPGWVCDPGKLMTQTGWQVTAPLDEHYVSTYAWYQQAGWL